MKIEVLGPGCRNCDTLYQNVLTALEQAGRKDNVEVTKVKDLDYFLKKGVFVTPALVIDGKAVSSGRVLTPEQVTALLPAEQA
jgi:small redox-active disulfide protein 2